MRPGTVIRLPDGREATVVYHGPDGYGIRFGRIALSDDDLDAIMAGHGNVVHVALPPDVVERIQPEAMLRDPLLEPLIGLPCVGDRFEIVEEPS